MPIVFSRAWKGANWTKEKKTVLDIHVIRRSGRYAPCPCAGKREAERVQEYFKLMSPNCEE